MLKRHLVPIPHCQRLELEPETSKPVCMDDGNGEELGEVIIAPGSEELEKELATTMNVSAYLNVAKASIYEHPEPLAVLLR